MSLVVIDYGAGNLQSVLNVLDFFSLEYKVAKKHSDLKAAAKIILPGVGTFEAAVNELKRRGLYEGIHQHLNEGKPYLGICIGFQLLASWSEESQNTTKGFGLLPTVVRKFTYARTVPHIGWNTVHNICNIQNENQIDGDFHNETSHLSSWEPWVQTLGRLYFVHSYRVGMESLDDILQNKWNVLITRYSGEPFISMVRKNEIIGTQFHPEKSGGAGLEILKRFVLGNDWKLGKTLENSEDKLMVKDVSGPPISGEENGLAKRIIPCLDVRNLDDGELAVTKGDQYDVRHDGKIRNLGHPKDLAYKYYKDGADELIFLSIKSYNKNAKDDIKVLNLVTQTAKNVFIPLCVGGGIRDIPTPDSDQIIKAVDVASAYFRAGADKVSIGSDGVMAALRYLQNGKRKDGNSSIEQIASRFGRQAVVLSVDAKRVFIDDDEVNDWIHHGKHFIFNSVHGQHCWYQCTTQGGRQSWDLNVVDLIIICEDLGAGEILINCIDQDGTNKGFDYDLINLIKETSRLPVIASSGAGSADHFIHLFQETKVDAALAAGIFHRDEVSIPGSSTKELSTFGKLPYGSVPENQEGFTLTFIGCDKVSPKSERWVGLFGLLYVTFHFHATPLNFWKEIYRARDLGILRALHGLQDNLW